MASNAMDQLQEIAMATRPNNRGRGRGQGQRGRGTTRGTSQGQPQGFDSHAGNHANHNPGPPSTWDMPPQAGPGDTSAFPPLGPQQRQTRRNQQAHQGPYYSQQQQHHQSPATGQVPPQQYQRPPQQNYQQQNFQQGMPYQQSTNSQNSTQSSPQNSFGTPRSRGYRGGYQQRQNSNQYHTQNFNAQPPTNTNDFSRPPVHPNNRLYAPASQSQIGTSDQQRAFRHKIMTQSDFLASLASQNLKNQMTQEELQAKENFRRKLQRLAQDAIASADPKMLDFNVEDVKLRLYGSLGSGFAVAGSDMDLLLAFPKHEDSSGNIEIESRRLLERFILDAGHGARLLTNTRVPILKVCETPTPELLNNLRAYRHESMMNEEQANNGSLLDLGNELLPNLTTDQTEAAAEALTLLDLEATEIPLPESPILERAKLEFGGDCGIQCDINFSNYVALHNTELLKTYGRADSRVRQMGIFVKNWAKARDINTPYQGTLSSYGYILLVLHYLMNIVRPPVIPNLQAIRKKQDEWQNNQEIELVEGFDVRFVHDPAEVQEIIQQMPKNHESLGSLLRGFFWYYSALIGFHWGQDVISIRTEGGRMSKRSKGWTEAKWANQSSHVRLRYLLAIEDPFETEHNVGRTVGHSGIVAIRDEFRRAWSIIDTIEYDMMTKTYLWLDKTTGEKQNAEDFMSILTDRGDLLRKDQNFHKDKMRRLRQEAEAKEQELKDKSLEDAASVATADEVQTNGTWTDENSDIPSGIDTLPQSDWSSQELIHHDSSQAKNWGWRSKPSRRRLQEEWDNDTVDDDVKSSGDTNVDTISDNVKPVSDSQGGEWQHKDNLDVEIVTARSPDDTRDKVRMKNSNSSKFRSKKVPAFARDGTVQTWLEPHSRAANPDRKVGNHIFWDRQTEGGRWLCWRDGQIQANRIKTPHSSMLQGLNDRFPHNPEMSYAELAVMNSELLKYYKDTLYPVDESPPQAVAETSDRLSSEWTVDGNDDPVTDQPEEIMPTQDLPDSDVQSSPSGSYMPECVDSVFSDTSSVLDLQQLRERRTMYYSQNTKPNDTTSNPADMDTSEEHRAEKDYPIASNSSIREGPRKDSAISFVQSHKSKPNNIGTEHPTVPEIEQQSADEQSNSVSQNHQQKLLSLLNVRAIPPVKHLVPLTLYPDVPNDQRPRDEDPRIMPIPRQLGFQFDPRQLADLDIIKQGGNGCAKRGEEFSIEEYYEFGGGGEMAYKSSSGLRCMSDSGLELSWRPGQGDQDGLLSELPGLTDSS